MSTTHSRRIVLTGVTRGLGRALTDQFVQLGQVVFGSGRTPKAIDELQRTYAAPHHFETIDVADAGQVQAWAAELIDQFGPPDLLVNNAAIINADAPLWEVPREAFDRLIDINIKGVTNVLRSFLPAMVSRKQGVVVNFSSGWGRSTAPGVAPYCASKFAIEGLTRALAQELPSGMAAVPLNPGIIDTDMLRSTFGESASSYPSAKEWATRAAPYLLQLGPRDNGKPLSIA